MRLEKKQWQRRYHKGQEAQAVEGACPIGDTPADHGGEEKER